MKKKTLIVILIYVVVLLSAIGAAITCSRVVTVVAETSPIERKHTIIIDAGHGGEDGGAVSCTGIPESRINLEISKRLDDLMHLLGFETLMVRNSDISIYTEGKTLGQKKASDLKARVKLVNETPNAILISIHQNTYSQSRYSGAQVFYTNHSTSQMLAKNMQDAFIATVNPGSNRQAKRVSGLYLFEHITRPGLLVECGFLTNHEEEAKLRTPQYQKKLCCVIVATVSEYLNT